MKKLFKGGEITCFGDFMREVPEGKRAPYEEIADRAALKRFCEEKLEDLNMEPGAAQMDLVMFGDALSHVCRITPNPNPNPTSNPNPNPDSNEDMCDDRSLC